MLKTIAEGATLEFMRRVLLTLFAFAAFAGTCTAAVAQPLQNCGQLLVVTTSSWSAPSGAMSIFERDSNGSWRQRGSKCDVRIGRAGLGWGRGIVETKSLSGPRKREGDDKAPAGIFRLGSVFGSKRETKMPFIRLSKDIVCVDDPDSQYYNRIVDASKIRPPSPRLRRASPRDWRHAEQLFGVDVYKWGVFVEHNVPPKPRAGSCIFLHVWKTSRTSTSGCTAMSEQNLISIIHWLDPKKHPLLVQLPRPVYDGSRSKWNLP